MREREHTGELERVQQLLHLIHAPSHVGIVNAGRAYDTRGINDEDRPLRDPLLLDQDSIFPRDTVVAVTYQRYTDTAQPTLIHGHAVPGAQDVLRVCAHEEDGGVALREIRGAGVEGGDLAGADEGPGHGEECEDDPLLVV